MVKAIWISDIHLEFLNEAQRKHFYISMMEEKADFLLCSGDIANSELLSTILVQLQNLTKRIVFTLGNHDLYGGSYFNKYGYMPLMSSNGYIDSCIFPYKLYGKYNIVGSMGWYDLAYGQPNFELNDFNQIKELIIPTMRRKICEGIAYQSAMQILGQIGNSDSKKFICLTHVPPVRNGDADSYFTNSILMEMLCHEAQTKQLEIHVLCGHTHKELPVDTLSEFGVYIHSNIAEYGKPRYQILYIDNQIKFDKIVVPNL